MKQSENDSATQGCWRSYREPTHVGGPRPHRGRAVPRPDRENFLSDSGPHCRELPQSGARGTRRSQEATSEEERTEKESQPEEPVMEKKTGRGNVRLSSTARWRRTIVIWTTLPRGSNSGKQKTSADDTRREKRTTSGTTGTKSWHCNSGGPAQRYRRRRRTAKPLRDNRQQARMTRASRSEESM